MDYQNMMAQLRASFADERSTKELIQLALVQMDQDEADGPWALTILHYRGTQEVFDACKTLCQSADAKKRALGADVLGQRGLPENPFLDETIELLLSLLESEADPNVLHRIGIAFGHLYDPRAIEPLIKLKNHADSDVRFGVVMGLWGHDNQLAIQTLIELSQDEDADVRDWATCGIGSVSELDTPEIRAALFKNIDDVDEATRFEAIAGLVLRRVREIIPRVIDEIHSGEVDADSFYGEMFCEMLAELQNEIKDPHLPDLLGLCKDDPSERSLQES